jgi:hypothetical protein
MRASLSIVPLCLLVAACSQPAADPRGVARDEVLLQVVASGRAEARPDEARFTAGVQTIAPTAAAASGQNSAVINRVMAALERLEVKPDDVQTQQISLSRIEYGPNRGRFQANNMVEVRIRRLDRAGAAISATTEAGANVLSGPNLTVSDPENASRSAYALAFKAARARAEAYAEAAGLKVARVLAIRDAGDGNPQHHYGDASAAMTVAPQEASPQPIVRPGMNAARVQVRADFALSAK